jgi:phage/plasmid-like protein (TIGR03299 family)
MAHEIDQTIGRDAIAYINKVPWHGLGQKVEENLPLDEWRIAAGLDWGVEKTPVLFHREEDSPVINAVMKNRRVLYRTDTGAPLSIVSDRYQPVQPAEILDFFKELIEVFGVFHMETAGALRGGRKIWALAKSTRTLEFANGKDVINEYLLLATSYDRSIPTLLQPTSIRVVCNNTLGFALDDKRQFRVSHITKFDGNKIRRVLNLDAEWLLFGERVEVLASKAVKELEAKRFFLNTFFTTKAQAKEDFSKSAADRRVTQMMDIYKYAPGQELPTAKDTAWGLVNAVTYYADHGARSRSADMRFDKAQFGSTAALKNRALTLVAELV